MTDSHEVTVGPEGRVLIPAEVRRAVGIEPGTRLVVRVEGEQVVLTPREAIKRVLREMFAGIEGSMAEELIAERRTEAARDSATAVALPWPSGSVCRSSPPTRPG